MRIQNNNAANNALRQYSSNNSTLSKNLEKLSSGYQINRAGDDAAGLAISEKMRSQITGLEKATDNSNDGISLVQTAEGALTEVHSMLNRMTELATQSANGTFDDETDRASLQEEVDSLLEEIDRISESTNYNGINLLDGSVSSSTSKISKTDNSLATFADVDATKGVYTSQIVTDLANIGDTYDYTINYEVNGKQESFTASYTATAAAPGVQAVGDEIAKQMKDAGLDELFDIDSTTTPGVLVFTAKDAGTDGAVVTGVSGSNTVASTGVKTDDGLAVTVTTAASDASTTVDISALTVITAASESNDIENSIITVNGERFAFVDSTATAAGIDPDINVVVAAGANPVAAEATTMAALIEQKTGVKSTTDGLSAEISISEKNTTSGSANGLQLQVGDTAENFNKVSVGIDDMSSYSLGLSTVDISSQSGADSALAKIKSAINTVSATRGKLGATQNRLEHTINNLAVTTENITEAESRIRDVDMAKEMTEYTQNNILSQASQAMLAQANQLPQGVLQLLQ
ncbi:MAG: flagellin [Anaerotignaceae bacterium]